MAEFQIPSEEYVSVEYYNFSEGKRKISLQVASGNIYITAKEARKIAKALEDAAEEFDADK